MVKRKINYISNTREFQRMSLELASILALRFAFSADKRMLDEKRTQGLKNDDD